jgi:hypothetical protein
MRLLCGLIMAFLALSVLAEHPCDCGLDETAYPPSFTTLSMLNG